MNSKLVYTVSYKYNSGGIRVQITVSYKTTNVAVTTDYIVSGSQILAETTNGNTIWYHIDGEGKYIGFEYLGVKYYTMYNAQGNVCDRRQWRKQGAKRRGRNTAIGDRVVERGKPEPMFQQEMWSALRTKPVLCCVFTATMHGAS